MIELAKNGFRQTLNAGRANGSTPTKKLRFAVVGLGHIAQVAVLPAFKHARDNSELTALVSGDPIKRLELSKKYKITNTYTYEQYEDCLHSGEIDAVYIALPNDMHCEYTIRAAEAGVHVLCEKPMAVNEDECRRMIDACVRNNVKLMIAYRLHFEEGNLQAVHLAKTGDLGDLRFFSSDFSEQVVEDNIRLDRDKGGGTLYDIGVYCINAARYLFRDEPTEVMAFTANNGQSRFREVDEMTSCIMRFPRERLATFTCSFGASSVGAYRLVGTAGDLRVEPSYPYSKRLEHYLTVDGKTKKRLFSKRDQFAPQLLYFSKCVLENKNPEPDGWEGLADVRIIEALYRSADIGHPVPVERVDRTARPDIDQQIHRPAIAQPEVVHAQSPSGD